MQKFEDDKKRKLEEDKRKREEDQQNVQLFTLYNI